MADISVVTKAERRGLLNWVAENNVVENGTHLITPLRLVQPRSWQDDHQDHRTSSAP